MAAEKAREAWKPRGGLRATNVFLVSDKMRKEAIYIHLMQH